MSLERDAADAYCFRLMRGHYENFSVAFGHLDGALRRDLARFYAFCRTTDDLGDESGTYALARLARWRDEFEATLAGEPATHPVLLAIGETIARRALPAQPFFDLIQANVQDQSVASYATWAELDAYCRLSAAPVGRIVLRLFGVQGDEAERLSDDVCIGLQLANHAQDVSRDAAIGRSYLVESAMQGGHATDAVRAMCDRARLLLASGRRLECLVPFALRLQLALYRLGGLAICDAIAAIGYATPARRPSLDGAARLRVVFRAFAQAIVPMAGSGRVEPA